MLGTEVSPYRSFQSHFNCIEISQVFMVMINKSDLSTLFYFVLECKSFPLLIYLAAPLHSFLILIRKRHRICISYSSLHLSNSPSSIFVFWGRVLRRNRVLNPHSGRGRWTSDSSASGSHCWDYRQASQWSVRMEPWAFHILGKSSIDWAHAQPPTSSFLVIRNTVKHKRELISYY